MIIIHVAQGSCSGTISWFKDPRSNVSVHYVVARDGRVAQCATKISPGTRRILTLQQDEHRHSARRLRD
jgi:hypothetical protein